MSIDCECWKDFDVNAAKAITKFKQDYIMCLGDLRVRSIAMSVSAAFMYKLISFNTVGYVAKTRNLAASFLFMGYFFAPELFNPFINKERLALV